MADVVRGRGPYFAQVPHALLDDEEIDAICVAVYASLMSFVGFRSHEGEATDAEAARRAHVARSTFKVKRAKLRERGWIDWESGKEDGRPNRYILHMSTAEGGGRETATLDEGGGRETATGWPGDAEGVAGRRLPSGSDSTYREEREDRGIEKRNGKDVKRARLERDVEELHEHVAQCYVDRLGPRTDGSRRPGLKLTEPRRKSYRARMRDDGFTLEEMKGAASAFFADDWGERDKYLDPAKYTFKDEEQTRRWLMIWREREQGATTAADRRLLERRRQMEAWRL
jgi:hypothetical protein